MGASERRFMMPRRVAGGFSFRDVAPDIFLRADMGVAVTGAAVDSWTDQAHGHIFVPDGASPDLTANYINGKPGIVFVAASSEFLELVSGYNITAETEIWVVFKKTSTPSGATFIDTQSANIGAMINCFSTTDDYSIFTGEGTPTSVRSTVGVADGVAAFLSSHFSTSSDDSITINNSAPVTGTIVAPAGTGIRVGRRGGAGTSYLDAGIAEILMRNPLLNAVERADYVAYLASWYGIS